MNEINREIDMPCTVSDLQVHLAASAVAITATCTAICLRAASSVAPTGVITMKFDGPPDEAQLDIALASFDP